MSLGRKFARLLVWLLLAGPGFAGDFDPLPMRKEYIGENLRLESPVYYYPEAARSSFRILIENGVLIDSEGIPFSSYLNQSSLYVITPELELLISKTQRHGFLHHSSLSAGGPLLAAGTIVVRDGVIHSIDLESGHYRFPDRYIEFLKAFFFKRGVTLSGVGFQDCASGLKIQPQASFPLR